MLQDGFYHSLGHGVGLEVHEEPSLGRAPGELVAGDVIAVEPGLYRHGYGGCRLEDLVLVTENGARGADGLPVRPRALVAHAIETILLEERRYPPPPEFAAQANAQPEIYDRDFDEFWETEARERVTWFEDFTKLYEWEPPYAKWYLGGKLNVAYNCVDRHVEAGKGDKVAYHWEGEPEDERRTITFADLQGEVVKLANALKKLGVGKGTPVGIYLGMVPEAPVAMLACARLGAPHTVVFGGFSADALADRLNDMGCEVLITQDEGLRNGGEVPLKRNADEALSRAPGVKHAVVLRRTGGEVDWNDEPRPLVARARRRRSRRPRVVPVRADGLRGPALPALHERHDRQAEGDRAHDGRLPRRHRHDPLLHLRRQARLGLLVRGRHRLGHRPQLHRLRAALQRHHERALRGRARTSRTRTAGGRSSSATRSTSSTRRRPRSGRT